MKIKIARRNDSEEAQEEAEEEREEEGWSDGDIEPPVEDPNVSWQNLQAYASEEFTREALRSIPKDMAEALQLEPVLMLSAMGRLHGLMSHWTTRLAYAKGRHSAAKAAREIGLEALKADRRRALNRMYEKVTEGMVNERAKATEEFARLCLVEARAETEWVRIKGLVDAIVTKREALKMMSFFVRPEMGMASEAYISDSDHPDEGVNDSLVAAQNKMRKFSKKFREE